MRLQVNAFLLLILLAASFLSYHVGTLVRQQYFVAENTCASKLFETTPSDATSAAEPRSQLPIWKNEIDIDIELLLHQQAQQKMMEMIIHPAMLAHENPEVVVVIMNETILEEREWLREQVELHVDTVITLTPKTTGCGTESMDCFPYEEENAKSILSGLAEKSQKVDVLILLDDSVTDTKLWKDRYLSENGILVTPIMVPSSSCTTATSTDRWKNRIPPPTTTLSLGKQQRRERLQDAIDMAVGELEKSGFARANSYQPQQQSFHDQDVAIVIAFPTLRATASWHVTEAQVNLELYLRMKGQDAIASTGPSMLLDSTILQPIEFPPKWMEREFCKRHPYVVEDDVEDNEDDEDDDEDEDDDDNDDEGEDDEEVYAYVCEDDDHGFDPTKVNIHGSQLLVKKSAAGERAGRGVYSTVDIPADSYITLETAVSPVVANWKATEILEDMWENDENGLDEWVALKLYYYFDGYGFIDEPFGTQQYTVDSSLSTFINHGCNGTYNMGEAYTDIGIFNEFTLDIDAENFTAPAALGYDDVGFYNPIEDRRITHGPILAMTAKPVKAGEELLDNYLTFGGDGDYFIDEIIELRNECTGMLGHVERVQDGLVD